MHTTTMAPNKLYVTVPSFFRCPISLDVMRSPVSLSTGVTYDRASIQHWLDSGHDTCPATNQQLPSKAFVPNLTLHRLISLWISSQPSASIVSRQEVGVLVNALKGASGDSMGLSKIVAFVEFSEENRRFCVEGVDGFLEVIAGVLGREGEKIEVLELGIKVLSLVLVESGVEEKINSLIFGKNLDSFLSSVFKVLEKGSLESKIGAVRVLELITINDDSRRALVKDERLLAVLFDLLGSENDLVLQETLLSFLVSVSATRLIRVQLVELGVVPVMTRILSDCDSKVKAKTVVELCMKLLYLISSCSEGRAAICGDLKCVQAILQWLMKVSSSATGNGVVVLWSTCCLCYDGKVQDLVAKANGMTKILLVMQSNCEQKVKRMCRDLIKVLTNGSGKSCLGGYETKTTHIRPY